MSEEAVRAALRRYDYYVFGLRCVNELPRDGVTLPPSRVWDRGEVTEDLLPGTSALRVGKYGDNVPSAMRAAADYGGQYMLLLGAEKAEAGDDDGEIVMREPIVLERWRRPPGLTERLSGWLAKKI